jgi:hypothetical protein
LARHVANAYEQDGRGNYFECVTGPSSIVCKPATPNPRNFAEPQNYKQKEHAKLYVAQNGLTIPIPHLSKDVGLILFANTSLSEQEMRQYYDIFPEIWKHAERLKSEK